MKKTKDEIDRIVAALDETRRSEYFRNPDRPDGSIIRPRRQPNPAPISKEKPRKLRSRRNAQPTEVIKAKSRIRVAAWRNDRDRRCAPTTEQIGAALVAALATTERLDALTPSDPGLVGKMLVTLRDRGFDILETVATLKRVRSRLRAAHAEDHAAGPGRR